MTTTTVTMTNYDLELSHSNLSNLKLYGDLDYKNKSVSYDKINESSNELIYKKDNNNKKRKKEISELRKTILSTNTTSKFDSLAAIDICVLPKLLKVAKNAEESWVTQGLRIAQKVMRVVTNYLVPCLGWGIIILSLIAIFTDPTHSIALLSVIKGIGLGAAILLLGPIIPNFIEKCLAWAEYWWVNSYFDYIPDKSAFQALQELKAWDKIDQHIDSYSRIIDHTCKTIKSSDGSSTEYNSLMGVLSKIGIYINVKGDINHHLHEGGQLLLNYIKA